MDTFGSGFTTSSLFDSGNAPLADSPANVFKAFGAGAGATQSFPAVEGDVFFGSGVGQNFVGNGQQLVEPGQLLLQVVFRDANGAFAGTAAGGNFAPGFNVFDGNKVDWTTPVDNEWTTLGVGTAPAPDNTASVDFNVLVLAPAGGAGFFDSTSFSQVPEPSSFAALGLGAIGLVVRRRRR